VYLGVHSAGGSRAWPWLDFWYVCLKGLAKRDEVTGEWRRLHNEELNDLHYSPLCG
jgi:hypothetical protein